MKQFNLEEYLQNPDRKVITRDGRSARIICTDKKCEGYPIVALVEDKYGEVITCNTKEGVYLLCNENHYDLFFAPEKYEGWTNVYVDDNFRLERTFIYKSEEEARAVGVRRKGYVATVKIEWEE